MYLTCPQCGNRTLERVRRRCWIRLLPKSRRFRCYVCHHKQLCVFGQQPRKGENAPPVDGDAFYVLVDGVTYGPATLEDLRSWAEQGRLHGGHSVSRGPEKAWKPAETMTELGLTWCVHPDDTAAESYLLHPAAVTDLYRDEAIPDTVTVTDTQTDRTFSLKKAVDHSH